MKKKFILFVILFCCNSLFAQEVLDPINDSIQTFTMPYYPDCENTEGTDEEKQECSLNKIEELVFEHMKYPILAREAGIQGVVVVSFVIEKDGSVTHHKIVRDVKAGCGYEALRVIKMMSDWTPAKQDGKLVRVLFHLPITFTLGDTEHVRDDSQETLNLTTIVLINKKNKPIDVSTPFGWYTIQSKKSVLMTLANGYDIMYKYDSGSGKLLTVNPTFSNKEIKIHKFIKRKRF